MPTTLQTSDDIMAVLGEPDSFDTLTDVSSVGGDSPIRALQAQPVWPYVRAAAVLSTFDPTTLRPYGSPPTLIDVPAALQPLCTIVTRAPLDGGKPRWALLNDVRRTALASLGNRDTLLHALEANTPGLEDAQQRILTACIHGNMPNVQTQNLEETACTLQAIGWLTGIIDPLPDKGTAEARAAWLNLLEPFRFLVGNDFRGRTAELARMTDYVQSPPRVTATRSISLAAALPPPLLIHGVGGVGKSTLAAKFILDWLSGIDGTSSAEEGRGKRPWAYLDIDHTNIEPEQPLTLMAEMTRQLGLQRPRIRSLAERFRRKCIDRLSVGHSRSTSQFESGSISFGFENERGSYSKGVITQQTFADDADFLDELASLVRPESATDTSPLLLIIDTFEEVQYVSRDVVATLWDFFARLQRAVTRSGRSAGVRVVLVGRSTVQDYATEDLHLPDLDYESSLALLARFGITDKSLASQIYAEVRGNPLSLKLVAALISKGEPNERLDPIVASGQVQGQLYRRILNHIHNDDVRRLAHPGLVLRRITPDIIQRVLAVPCGVTVDSPRRAQELFDELARESALVNLDVSDGALVHRSDVRQIMLTALQQDDPLRAHDIHTRAVAYYQERDGAPNRAEEIYHRFFIARGSGEDEIEPRWIPGLEPFLRDAVEEIPAQMKHFLLAKLGVTSDQFVWDEASLAEWEQHVATRVRDLHSTNQLDLALKLLGERRERTDNSPLFLLEAQTLERLGRYPEAYIVANDGIYSAKKTGNDKLRLDLLLLSARANEKLGQYERARNALNYASQVESGLPQLDDDLLKIEIATQRLRMNRLSAFETPDALKAIKADVNMRLGRSLAAGFRRNAYLFYDLTREIGVEQPKLLFQVRSLSSVDLPRDSQQLAALAYALAEWDEQVSSQNGEVVGVLARTAKLNWQGDGFQTWRRFLFDASRDTQLTVIETLIGHSYAPTQKVVDAFVDALTGPQQAPTPKSTTSHEAYLILSSLLFDQYPDRNKLSTFVRRSLKLALDTIAPATLYGDALYQLVEWMDKNDLLRDLIHKGLKIRSDQKIDNLITSLSSTTRGTPTPEPTSASASTPTTRPIVLPRTLALQPPPGAIRKGVSAFVVPELLVNWTKRMQECARAVCRINLGSGLGTGFLIAPNLLLTAGHNINFIDGENGSTVRCEFDFQINAQGQAQTPVIYQLASEWLVDSVVPVVPAASANKTESKDSLDFALIRLADTPGLDLVPRTMDRRGWLTTDTSHTFAKGEPLFMLHHFQGAPLVLEHGKLHRAVTPEDVNIRLTSDTGIRAPGAGGAPCFDATWNVVAMRTQSDRSGKKLIISGPLIRTILQRPKMAEALKESLALATTVA